MASVSCTNVIRWARQHIKLVPILAVGGTSDQPGLDFCQDTLNKILGRPYKWRWNRTSYASFTTVDGQYAYAMTATNVAWLERAYIELEADTSSPKRRERLEVVQDLPVPWYKDTPQRVSLEIATAADVDNNAALSAGATIFRVDPIPGSEQWRIYVDYQKAAPVLTSTTTDTFTPIPAELSDLVRQVFLGHAMRMLDDRRADMEMARAEAMIFEKMAFYDAEASNEGFYPDRSIMMW